METGVWRDVSGVAIKATVAQAIGASEPGFSCFLSGSLQELSERMANVCFVRGELIDCLAVK